jgi:hypothetical protein
MTVPHFETSKDGPAPANVLCERPIPLQKDALRRRIYAPQAYAAVRNVAVVPIVHSECGELASWFPLVWRRGQERNEFVAVRALLNDQRAQPPAARGLLPLILHAYPFVLDPNQPAGPNTQRMLDDVFADAPTDVGASITTVHLKLSRATTSRFRMLDRFTHEAAITAEISQAVAELDVLDPWALKFDIDEHRVEIQDLLVIRPSAFDDGRLSPLLEKYGMPCAQMLGLHRISLFRAGVLLSMAKAFFRDNRDVTHDDGRDAGAHRRPEHHVAIDTHGAPTQS